jgi:NitT/TauT family transport system permease protein
MAVPGGTRQRAASRSGSAPSGLAAAFMPNRVIDAKHTGVVIGVWIVVALVVWLTMPFETLPKPADIWRALGEMWWRRGMGPELFTTLRLILHATLLTTVLSLSLAYLTVVPFFRPLVEGLSKLRFLGLTGLVFPFTLLTGGGYPLKVVLLTFGMTTFYVTSMAQVVSEIPRAQFDYMRVLGAGELRILWEVVVRGTLDRALDGLRQNLAMGWAMITMVEGISRAEGGIGALIIDENRHFLLAEVYAILLVILIVGLAMDYGMGVLTNVVCPHARLDRVAR